MENSFILQKCYGNIEQHTLNRFYNIKLLICDVDGVMSDGMIYLGENGELLKSFNVRDNYGIRCLLTANIKVAIISGRFSQFVENHCKILGIKNLYQGQSDKTIAFQKLLKLLLLKKEEVAYIGDDLIDIPIMNQVGLSIAVSDAHPIVRIKAHYTTNSPGGHGAIREICDLLLLMQNKYPENINLT